MVQILRLAVLAEFLYVLPRLVGVVRCADRRRVDILGDVDAAVHIRKNFFEDVVRRDADVSVLIREVAPRVVFREIFERAIAVLCYKGVAQLPVERRVLLHPQVIFLMFCDLRGTDAVVIDAHPHPLSVRRSRAARGKAAGAVANAERAGEKGRLDAVRAVPLRNAAEFSVVGVFRDDAQALVPRAARNAELGCAYCSFSLDSNSSLSCCFLLSASGSCFFRSSCPRFHELSLSAGRLTDCPSSVSIS